MSLPGELSGRALIDRVIRVDHAGEYGAVRIYAGQLAVLKDPEARAKVQHMMDQERPHLAAFDKMIVERRVRPTALMPLWHVAGFAMGAATALLGPRAAMACTAAVESVIDEHYAAQRDQLPPEEKALADTIEKFRQEEAEHHDTAIEEGAEQAPFYDMLHAGVSGATRLAIWLSSRI